MSELWEIGDRVEDRYEIRAIKKGGMGNVFICYDREKNKTVAIKTYQDRFLKDNASVKRFLSEAETWIKIGRHRNIVQAFYVPMWMYRPYIIMEYIAGHEIYGADLAAWLARRSLPLSTTLDFAIQFCSGMIHAENVFKLAGKAFVHRDIKPSNILITSTGTIKITDFGISHAVSGIDCASGCGTPAYMSPEQVETPHQADTRSDIFSFGRVLERMTAPLGRQDFPTSLHRCIRACLEKDPNHRFSGFSELREALLKIHFKMFGKACRESMEAEKQSAAKEDLLNRCASFQNLGLFEDAIVSCDELLSLPGVGDIAYKALCLRGSALAGLGKKEAALEEFAKAIDLFKEAPFAYIMRGNLYNDTGRFRGAMADYNQAVELDDALVFGYYNRGLCLIRMGAPDDALEDFNRAIALGFSDACLIRGNIYLQRGAYDEALSDFKTAIDVNPRDAAAYLNIGIVYEERNELEEALNYYNRSIQVNPHYLTAYYRRGLLFGRKLNLPEDAMEDFEKVLSSDPEESNKLSGGFLKLTEYDLNTIYYNTYRDLGISCCLLEQYDRAKRYLKKYLDFPAIERDGPEVIERISGTVLWLETKA